LVGFLTTAWTKSFLSIYFSIISPESFDPRLLILGDGVMTVLIFLFELKLHGSSVMLVAIFLLLLSLISFSQATSVISESVPPVKSKTAIES